MAQRAADVARREAALAASEGPAADLAARLRAADERIFEQRAEMATIELDARYQVCLLYTSPSPRDATLSRMPSSA